MKKVLTNHSRE